ncbi:hypothetical protein [Winogradskyella psychrotolerans]|uniref:hypothetical protein n=1 Tax=Winogradskyella psychrotolerans TaxID=1344585 RepID=UPI001C068C05|nr:hypothetical protein [Winogradskyella psychrotolerans]MBU2929912.1 hypothetical protein [Winogradskyella psychrotolerans]
MTEILTFDFCDIAIHNHYVIVVINEGITVTPKHNSALIKITETYFLNKPFVYISHRCNSYAINPEIYYETAKIETLVGLAVVSSNYQAKINAQIEKMFFTKPFEIFTEIDDAVAWAKDLVAEQ